MSKSVTLGGDRLGSGNKMKVYLKHYERSNHNLSYAWRNTMAPGTLVPFMCEVAQAGDTFDIDLAVKALTGPTVGPLFGNMKLQLDVFAAPIRLFQGALHMNMLNIGRDMSKVKLPLIELEARQFVVPPGGTIPNTNEIENSQINPSCILNYLGIRGLGSGSQTGLTGRVKRQFNAIPWLAYWAIYKQYYASKSEEKGAVIHQGVVSAKTITAANYKIGGSAPVATGLVAPGTAKQLMGDVETTIEITVPTWPSGVDMKTSNITFGWYSGNGTPPATPTLTNASNLFNVASWNDSSKLLTLSGIKWKYSGKSQYIYYTVPLTSEPQIEEPSVTLFPLKEIDDMRLAILQKDMATPLVLSKATLTKPYSYLFEEFIDTGNAKYLYSKTNSQEGLAVKTYDSDLFNSWLNTDWIDAVDGITAVTSVNVVANKVTIDELQLKKKLYDMLNRIAVSGGSYDDWLNAVYTHERDRGQEEASYVGGLIEEIGFEEVIGMASSEGQPLGTLGGRGTNGGNRKGGKVIVKIDEPAYIIGIASITPRIDYNQGNRWDVNLKTMDDFHKPGLDQIGFQSAITDQFAYWDTKTIDGVTTYKSAGKQPSWINYMTNYNRVYGNFAIENNQMWMVLTRRYTMKTNGSAVPEISDLTQYIDPKKFNYIFADTRRDAMNFWVQIGVGIHARRKMSAKIMPNL